MAVVVMVTVSGAPMTLRKMSWAVPVQVAVTVGCRPVVVTWAVQVAARSSATAAWRVARSDRVAGSMATARSWSNSEAGAVAAAASLARPAAAASSSAWAR